MEFYVACFGSEKTGNEFCNITIQWIDSIYSQNYRNSTNDMGNTEYQLNNRR